MKTQSSTLKVRYGETDQMGVVHHANYAQYFELARIEWLEKYGISYRELESSGVMLPVYDLKIRFVKPAFFDDKLTVETSLRTRPTAKIVFDYTIKNQRNECLTTGETTLVFTDTISKRPIRCPENILTALGL